MKLDWSHWLYSMAKAVIGGVATSISAWFGTATAHAIEQSIPVMEFSTLPFVLLTSTIGHLAFYLMKAPVPRDMEEPVEIKTKTPIDQ